MLIIINAQKTKLYFKLREFVDMVKRNYLNNYQITDAGPDGILLRGSSGGILILALALKLIAGFWSFVYG